MPPTELIGLSGLNAKIKQAIEGALALPNFIRKIKVKK
jgi:hypothetical protein